MTSNRTARTRHWGSLSEDTQARFRDYIMRNETVETQVLAEELNLEVTTLRAVKANLTRKTV